MQSNTIKQTLTGAFGNFPSERLLFILFWRGDFFDSWNFERFGFYFWREFFYSWKFERFQFWFCPYSKVFQIFPVLMRRVSPFLPSTVTDTREAGPESDEEKMKDKWVCVDPAHSRMFSLVRASDVKLIVKRVFSSTWKGASHVQNLLMGDKSQERISLPFPPFSLNTI